VDALVRALLPGSAIMLIHYDASDWSDFPWYNQVMSFRYAERCNHQPLICAQEDRFTAQFFVLANAFCVHLGADFLDAKSTGTSSDFCILRWCRRTIGCTSLMRRSFCRTASQSANSTPSFGLLLCISPNQLQLTRSSPKWPATWHQITYWATGRRPRRVARSLSSQRISSESASGPSYCKRTYRSGRTILAIGTQCARSTASARQQCAYNV
jgi:hypothetical protein